MKMMSAITKPRSPQRKALYILLPFLFVTAVIGYFLMSYQFKISSEKQSFMALRQDMLELQKQFNKIDEGWEYAEECSDNGQVYSRGKISSCSLEISNSKLPLERFTPDRVLNYLGIIKSGGWVKSEEVNSEDGEHFSSLTYKDRIDCILNLNSSSKIATLSCYGEAKEAYFPYVPR